MRSGPRHAVAQHAAAGAPWRRSTLGAVGLVLALVGALSLSARATSSPPPQPASAPALLGSGARGDSGTASGQQAAIDRLEAAIGRNLSIGHSFVPWGEGLGGE